MWKIEVRHRNIEQVTDGRPAKSLLDMNPRVSSALHPLGKVAVVAFIDRPQPGLIESVRPIELAMHSVADLTDARRESRNARSIEPFDRCEPVVDRSLSHDPFAVGADRVERLIPEGDWIIEECIVGAKKVQVDAVEQRKRVRGRHMAEQEHRFVERCRAGASEPNTENLVVQTRGVGRCVCGTGRHSSILARKVHPVSDEPAKTSRAKTAALPVRTASPRLPPEVAHETGRQNLWPLRVLAALAPFNVKLAASAWTGLQLRILVVASLGLVVTLAIRNLRATQWARPDWVDTTAYLWLVAVWVSALASADPLLGSGGAARVSVAILLVPVTRSMVTDHRDAVLILRSLAYGSAAAAVVGLGIWGWGGDLEPARGFVGQVTRLGSFDRLTRPWAHANVAAMALGATAAAAMTISRTWLRTVCLVLIAVALVLTVSRGGLLAASALGLSWVLLRRRGVDTLAAAALGVLMAITVLLSSAWTTRVDQLGDQAFYGSEVTAPASISLASADDTVEVTVTNKSSVVWNQRGEDRVLISARWLGPDGLIWIEDRWELPSDLAPGELVTTGLAIPPRVPVGAFDVRWDLLQLDTAYFGQFLGDPPTISRVQVTASDVRSDDIFRYNLVERNVDVGRLDAWQLAWDDFAGSPLIGVGPNQFAAKSTARLDQQRQSVGTHAHNIVLEPLAAWGLLGTVPFLALGIGALARSLRWAWKSRETVACVLAASLVAVTAHGIVDWPLVVITTCIPIGLLVGLAWTDGARDD